MAFIFQKVVNLQKDYIPNGGSSHYTVTQSICIHNASLSGQPDISLGSGTLKKGPKYGFQIAGCKKTGSLLFKKRRSSLFFCILLFATHSLDPFFAGSKTDPCFQNKNIGCRLTGRRSSLHSVSTTAIASLFRSKVILIL